MGLTSTAPRWPYTGNGVTTAFSYTSKILAQTDLVVTKRLIATGVETTLVITTDYTVAGVGDDAGGTVTLLSAPSSAYKIIIRRVRPLSQTTDIRNQTEYYAETHEDEFDHLTMIDLQQQDELDRSVSLPVTLTSADFDPKLPATIAGAISKLPTTNASGTGWLAATSWPSLTDLAAAVTSAAAAAASAAAALASEVAAAASAAAAVVSASAASASATSASGSATAAAASAVTAAASAASAGVGAVQSGTRASPNAIVAGTSIAVSSTAPELHSYIQGSGGAVTMSANPQIAVGTSVGQRLLLIGRSDTNTVTIANGTGVSLNGDIILGDDDNLLLYWDGTNWSEINRRR